MAGMIVQGIVSPFAIIESNAAPPPLAMSSARFCASAAAFEQSDEDGLISGPSLPSLRATINA